ncbi:MAG: leucyl aminopeptidase [Candidatus Paceibacteria bacterium]|jgi:leucyl aminopeptidase
MTKISLSKNSLEETMKKYCRVIITEDKLSWHRLVETTDGHLEYRIGAGKRKNMTVRTFRTLVRTIVQTAKIHQLENIAIDLELESCPKLEKKGTEWFYRTIAENLQLAQYEFTKYKTKQKTVKKLIEILVCGVSNSEDKKSFSAGLTVGESANFTRDIANTTGEEMTPSLLAKAAQNALKETGVIVKVLDHKTIKKLKMGLLDAVGKGATDTPNMIVMEYWGLGKPKVSSKVDSKLSPIALIGKGITYDSGGLNIKPSGAMHEMHMDMSGGAAVIGTMQAIAKLGLKKNVVALVPAAENSVSAESMRSGDIATSMSGQTVEILHTDAEGRMVLADAMTYAEKHYSPKVILDVATLTGASLSALGQHSSAIMTKDRPLQEKLVELGEDSGDLMWPLPLWDEYKSVLKSSRADISNIATNFSRFGGCIEGGTFLSFFAPKKTPWAHIDMAPRMESIPSDKLAKGATGEPVRMLVKFVESY